MKSPGEQDSAADYGGYDNYLAEAEAAAANVGLRPYGHFVLAAGFALVVARLDLIRHATPAGDQLPVFELIFVFLVTLVGCFTFLQHARLYGRTRAAVCLLLIAVFIVGFVSPIALSVRVWQRENAVVTQADSKVVDALFRATDKWRADIEAAGAHGPAGTEPPMLLVNDRGATLEVTNIADRAIECVLVNRVPEHDVELQANRNICHMNLPVSGYGCELIAPGATMKYTLLPDADPRCAEQPLEFRIGTVQQPEPTWWSDSALREFDRQWKPRR